MDLSHNKAIKLFTNGLGINLTEQFKSVNFLPFFHSLP